MKTKALKHENAKSKTKYQQAEKEFSRVLENVSVPGFYGTASVTVNVQDGHVQYTRVMVDRMIR